MKPILKILLIYASLLAFVIWCCSCNPTKKAIKRVLADPEAKEQVGREWEKQNPCTNDTITKTESDTVTVTETVEVPGYSEVRNDTTYIYLPGKVVSKTVTIRDTVYNTVTDNRRLKIANDSVAYYKGLSIQRQAQIDELNAELSEAKKSRNKAWLYFWILVAIAAGSHYLRSKLKIFG